MRHKTQTKEGAKAIKRVGVYAINDDHMTQCADMSTVTVVFSSLLFYIPPLRKHIVKSSKDNESTVQVLVPPPW
jgi:hypothetical protein